MRFKLYFQEQMFMSQYQTKRRHDFFLVTAGLCFIVLQVLSHVIMTFSIMWKLNIFKC